MFGPVAIALATAIGYLAIAPAVVNGDGLGYLKASVHGNLYPGHLGYVPLLMFLRRIAGVGPQPVDGLWVARALSAVSAGIAVWALGAAARRLFDARESPRAGLIASGGLAASFGCMSSGSDVETYAPALAALCLTIYGLARRRTGGGPASTVLAAVALAVATLLHVENVLFGLCALFALPRRDRVGFVAISSLLVLAAYGLAGFGAGWLLGASHGFHYPLSAATPFIALYGACKALLFSPYPYEASWARVLGHFVPGALALGTLAFIVLARDLARPTRAPLGAAATWAWAVPYGAVGVAFFASDAERWIFLLPLVWLTVATTRSRSQLALTVAVGLLLLNLAVWLPHARDTDWRDRARAVSTHLAPGDLVVSPGHGWDEYIGFYEGVPVGHFPLVFHAGQLGSADAVRRALAEAVRDARARHHEVYLVRFTDDGTDPMGWKELLPFGITRDNAASLFPPGAREPIAPALQHLAR